MTVILAGLPGLLLLPWAVEPPAGIPAWALLLNPALLLLLGGFAGAWAAPRCGFRIACPGTSLAARAGEAAGGLGLGLVLAVADHAGRTVWQAPAGAVPSLIEGWSAAQLVLGLLYGGVTEEVMLRWGVMSLLALGLWRIFHRGAAAPPAMAVGLAIAGSALLFAMLHLPALAAAGDEPTSALILRTLMLNGVAGAVFGWLFARRDLVAAMAAHGGAHLGFAAAALLARAIAG